MITTAGSPWVTITGCNAVLITNLAPVSGPNVPAGTNIVGGTCVANGVQLNQNATVTGSGLHTFTLPAYALNYPPLNQGIPTGLNCSVCPAVFNVNICAGNYVNYYMCVGNMYTFTMCSATPTWDSYLTVSSTGGTEAAGTPTYDDDGCGTVNGHATLTFVPTSSATYRVRLWDGNCLVNSGLCGTIQISCAPIPPPPPNDEATGAISLGSPAPTVCTPVTGTTTFATQSATLPSGCNSDPNCSSSPTGSFAGYDVWYSVGIPASQNLSVIITELSAGPLAFAVYTGTPGSLTQVSGSCSCSGFVSLSSIGTGTAYIRVWPRTGITNQGTFQICAYEPIPPPNDNPCGATSAPYVLPVPTTCNLTTFTTESATNLAAIYTVPAPSCGTPVAGGDVWFSAVMPATGSMTITSQAGTLTDMAMTVYTVSSGTVTNCGSQGAVTLSQVACNDNFGASNMPAVTVAGTPGVTYYIRMWNKTSAFGTASICAVQNVPPPNDNPCGALALTVSTGCYYSQPYSNSFASTTGTTAPGVVSIPAPSCGAPTNNDVWFTAVVPASGQLVLDMDDMQMTDAAYAVYTATGSCGSSNLSLTQVPAGNGGCAVGGSTNGALLPTGTVTGLTPGATVYIRVWRQTGNDGNFLICARNPQNPAGCYYTLRLADSAGDGWGASYVTLCINGSCTNYTVFGGNANIVFGAPLGAVVTLTYNAGGAGFQNQISYTLQASNGFSMFTSSNPPSTPFGFTVNSDCNVPPAPISDCIGAFQVCNNQSINLAPSNFGNTQDLNAANHGCLLGNEHQTAWYTFTTNAAGTIAFTIGVPPNTDYDFAVWGPYSGTAPCPPAGPPLRCSWSGLWQNTGLSYTDVDLTEGAGGNAWVRWIDALPNQTYMLVIDNWSQNGLNFNLTWNNVPNNILDCLLPVEFIDFEAIPGAHQVDLKWMTASERNTSHFNVERSFDGTTFETIGQVGASGNSSVVNQYGFTDRAPKLGYNYYRLDQVDNTGARKYSDMKMAYFRASGGLSVYPNPAGETLWASLEAAAEGTVFWKVLDASGRVVRAGNTGVPEGISQFEIPLDIDAGSYLLDLTDESGNPLGFARFVRR